METIQDKIKREQNGYGGGGRLRRDKQSKEKSNHMDGNTVLDGDGGGSSNSGWGYDCWCRTFGTVFVHTESVAQYCRGPGHDVVQDSRVGSEKSE